MKGRYKLRTQKWKIKATIQSEARELLRNRSEKQTRFLDAALQSERNLDQPSRRATGDEPRKRQLYLDVGSEEICRS